jgi:hypothetical protein
MPDVFISYVHAAPDGQIARWLRDMLEKSGLRVWLADVSLHASTDSGLNEQIAAAIAQSPTVVVMLSAQSAASHYCRAEIIHAMKLDPAILVLEVEPLRELPPSLMPLRGYARAWVQLHATQRSQWHGEIARGLAVCGQPGITLSNQPSDFLDVLLEARIIHPSYLKLSAKHVPDSRSLTIRASEAANLQPTNGYVQMNLALLLLHQSHVAGALEAARRAIVQIPGFPDAHYVLALAECASAPASNRTHAQVEVILRRLAAARRLTGAGYHIDLLSALVIANHYLVRYLTPPADPEQLIMGGVVGSKRMDAGENRRVLDYEPLADSAQTARVGACLREQLHSLVN